MGRLGAWRHQRVRRQPAHIAVGVELTPGPAFAVGFIDRDALALQGFGHHRGIRRGRAAQRRLRVDDFALLALDEALRLDLPPQLHRCEIGPRGRQARIGFVHVHCP
jgi:hypothetical protein